MPGLEPAQLGGDAWSGASAARSNALAEASVARGNASAGASAAREEMPRLEPAPLEAMPRLEPAPLEAMPWLASQIAGVLVATQPAPGMREAKGNCEASREGPCCS